MHPSPISPELHFRKNLDNSTLESGVARLRKKVEAGCLLNQLLQSECAKKVQKGRRLLKFLSLSSFCSGLPTLSGKPANCSPKAEWRQAGLLERLSKRRIAAQAGCWRDHAALHSSSVSASRRPPGGIKGELVCKLQGLLISHHFISSRLNRALKSFTSRLR